MAFLWRKFWDGALYASAEGYFGERHQQANNPCQAVWWTGCLVAHLCLTAFGSSSSREIVLYSGENIRIHITRLISLPWVHYYPAKPTPHKPRPWSISSGIMNVQASVSTTWSLSSKAITCSVMWYLITQNMQFIPAIPRLVGERVQCDHRDFAKVHNCASYSLVELEAGNQNHRNSTCRFHSWAFQPL